MKRLIAGVLRRPIGTVSVAIAVVTAGVAGMASSSVSLLPAIDVPVITVGAEYDGLPAEQMRELVTLPLERGLSGIAGLRGMQSTTRAGTVVVRLNFDWGTESNEAASAIREAVDALYPSLPNAVSRPTVRRVDPAARPAIRVALHPSGASAARVRRLAEREIRAAVQQLPGVGSVVVSGGGVEEIHVTVDQTKAQERNLDLITIREALIEGNSEYAAGSMVEGDLELFVTTDARLASTEELERVFIARDGSTEPEVDNRTDPVALSSLARVEPGYAPRNSVFHVDGREAIGLDIYSMVDSSPASVADRVSAAIPDLERSFGSSTSFEVVHDQSHSVRLALSEVSIAAGLGTVAAFLVLIVFLRSWQGATIVALSIPTSIGFSFALLAVFGVDLNVMSLAGLAIGIGMVVDNSIVVVENMHEYARGETLDAARSTAAVVEVSSATLSGTLTTIAVFLPLYALPGVAGLLYRDLATAVVSALVASYLTSITITPLLYTRFARSRSDAAGGAKQHTEKLSGTAPRSCPASNSRLDRVYRSLLCACLRRPATCATAAAAVTILTSLAFGGRVHTMAVEPVDQGEVEITLRVPVDYSVEASARQSAYIAEMLGKLHGVQRAVSRVGGEKDDPWFLSDPFSSPNTARIHLILDRRVSAHLLVDRLTARLEALNMDATVALPESTVAQLLRFNGGEGVAVYGESPAVSLARAERVVAEAEAGFEARRPLSLVPVERRQSILATPNRAVIDKRGISITDASVLLRSTVEGAKAGSLVRDGEKFDIRLFYGDTQQRQELGSTLLIGGVPLHEALHMQQRSGRSVLSRRSRRDVIYVKGAQNRIDTTGRPWMEDLGRTTIDGLARSLLPVFALAVLTIAAILILQFESLGQAALVLSVLPFALIGSVVGVAAVERPLTMQSAIGSLVLIGMVVNGAIMLIQTWNQGHDCMRHSRGSRRSVTGQISTLRASVVRGALRRLRPILMTNGTTIAAMVPLLIDPGIRSHQSGLAVAIVSGLLVGTVVTLFVLPPCYFAIGTRVIVRNGQTHAGIDATRKTDAQE